MADEVSNAELARRLDAFQREVHADVDALSRRMDVFVLREVYAAEKGRMEDRIASLEQRVKDGEDQRRTLVRWLISAIIVPAIVLIVQVVLALQGSS